MNDLLLKFLFLPGSLFLLLFFTTVIIMEAPSPGNNAEVISAGLFLNGQQASSGNLSHGITVDARDNTADPREKTVDARENKADEDFRSTGEKIDGYRGIWWSIRPMRDTPHTPSYGSTDFKYSGPLSFAWPHTVAPMAIYAPEVNKTFFVYGGDTGPMNNRLMTMASYYDHEKHRVPKPTIVRDQRGVDDPHDNPGIVIDDDGYIWVFIAGRSQRRPGQIYRSKEPWSVDDFEKITIREQTYSQVWNIPGEGVFHLLTLYTDGRELYWEDGRDGSYWTSNPTEDLQKLAGFGGHYQVSRVDGNKIGTVFNYHPDGNPDRRTNLYYLQTTDFGETWTTVDGKPVETPLTDRNNPALLLDYEERGKLVFPSTLLFDDSGNPAILYITSFGNAPVVENDPRVWKMMRWTGEEWVSRPVTISDHNYDMGTFYIHDDRWSLIAPAIRGPQPGFTGGEVGLWETEDPDRNWWKLKRRVTKNSQFNHGYMRRPHNPEDPFFAVWADGNSHENSISRIYFTNSTGDRLYKLPYKMDEEYAEPVLLSPPVPPRGDETSILRSK